MAPSSPEHPKRPTSVYPPWSRLPRDGDGGTGVSACPSPRLFPLGAPIALGTCYSQSHSLGLSPHFPLPGDTRRVPSAQRHTASPGKLAAPSRPPVPFRGWPGFRTTPAPMRADTPALPAPAHPRPGERRPPASKGPRGVSEPWCGGVTAAVTRLRQQEWREGAQEGRELRTQTRGGAPLSAGETEEELGGSQLCRAPAGSPLSCTVRAGRGLPVR